MSDLKEQILGKKNLHSYYYPSGDTKKEQLHDDNCCFCHYEEEVLEAMYEYANEMLKQANEVKTSASVLPMPVVVLPKGTLCECGRTADGTLYDKPMCEGCLHHNT